MRPFSLEQAKQGKKVVTRDGREVTQIVKFDVENVLYALRGVLDGKEIDSWTICGRNRANGEPHPLDLFMATEKKTVWVKVYFMSCGDSGVYIVSNGHTDIETLNRTYHDNENYICTKSIEIEV